MTPKQVDEDALEKEIEEDERKINDLFVDRYGAQPLHPAYLIKTDKFNKEVENSKGLVVAELFNKDSVLCLLSSIPIKELFKDYEINYRKVALENKNVS